MPRTGRGAEGLGAGGGVFNFVNKNDVCSGALWSTVF